MGEAKRRAMRGDKRVSPNANNTLYPMIDFADRPGCYVVGSGIFTVAISITPEGRGALLVVGDAPDGINVYGGLRQRQDGVLEGFDPTVLDTTLEVLNVEHPFLIELWEQWVKAGK